MRIRQALKSSTEGACEKDTLLEIQKRGGRTAAARPRRHEAPGVSGRLVGEAGPPGRANHADEHFENRESLPLRYGLRSAGIGEGSKGERRLALRGRLRWVFLGMKLFYVKVYSKNSLRFIGGIEKGR